MLHGDHGGVLRRRGADEAAEGGDIDHRFRGGGGREDTKHMAIQEGHVPDFAPEAQRWHSALRPPWRLAHGELQPH